MKDLRYDFLQLEAASIAVLGCIDLDCIITADHTAATAEEAIIDGLLVIEADDVVSLDTDLERALRMLDPEQRAVVEAAYGIDGCDPISMRDAAALWGRRSTTLLTEGLEDLRNSLT